MREMVDKQKRNETKNKTSKQNNIKKENNQDA